MTENPGLSVGGKATILDASFFLPATGRKSDSSQTQSLSKSSRPRKSGALLAEYYIRLFFWCFNNLVMIAKLT